jgi:hypothetical protein
MFNAVLGKDGEIVCTRAFTVTFSLIYTYTYTLSNSQSSHHNLYLGN